MVITHRIRQSIGWAVEQFGEEMKMSVTVPTFLKRIFGKKLPRCTFYCVVSYTYLSLIVFSQTLMYINS